MSLQLQFLAKESYSYFLKKYFKPEGENARVVGNVYSFKFLLSRYGCHTIGSVPGKVHAPVSKPRLAYSSSLEQSLVILYDLG